MAVVVGSGIIASVRFCCTGLCCNVIDFTCRDGNSILAREGMGAPGHTVNLNSSIQSDYISKIYITDAFEGDTTYTSNGISVIKAVGTHINATKNRVELTGGDSGTVTDKKNIDGCVSEGGKTLTIGGSGFAFSGDVDVSNLVFVEKTVATFAKGFATDSVVASKVA